VVAALHAAALVGIVGYELYALASPHFRYEVAQPADGGLAMRAARFHEFGPASVVRVDEVPQPSCCSPGQVLVKVDLAALNPVDFKQRRMPAPKSMVPLPATTGKDFSGSVVKVGEGVSSFKAGDIAFGMLPLLGQPWGAFEEFVVADASIIAKAPTTVGTKAAALPLVGLTVLHALAPVLAKWEAQGEGASGKSILVHAGSGGVGSFAIQYCKNVLGMRVLTTTSAKNADFVRSLGADEVVDYRSQRLEDAVKGMDVVLDTVAQEYEDRTLKSDSILKQGGRGHYVHVISTDWQPSSREANPVYMMLPLVKKWALSALARFGRGVYYHCNPVTPDGRGLQRIAGWVDQGLIHPVVDRVFQLEASAAAHEYLETGRAKGKVLVAVSRDAAISE